MASNTHRWPATVRVGAGDVSLSAFLRLCADSIDAGGDPGAADAGARDAFVDAGLAALAHCGSGYSWAQWGLRFTGWPPDAGMYAELRDAVDEALAGPAVRNVFYMHKPPGLRIRFEVAAEYRHEFVDALSRRAGSWCRAGVIDAVTRGVYEPETRLFGGPVSMRYVHRMFTHDTVAWLAHHARPAGSQEDPAWGVSLAMLRSLFAALGVDGWEDLGVWEWLSTRGGRRLTTATLARPELVDLVAAVTEVWHRTRLAPGTVFDRSVRADGAKWREEYLAGGHAVVGPRAVAALMTIFHWNRAGLSNARQALITHALMTRAGDER